MNGGTDLSDTAHIGRVDLRADDRDCAVDLYVDVVGIAVLDEDWNGDSTGGVALGVGSEPLLSFHGGPDALDAPGRSDRGAGLFHVAFRVPTRAALGATLPRLESRWRLTGASDHPVSEAIDARDPAGSGIEVYRDTPRDEWTARENDGVVDSLPLDLEARRVAATSSDGERERLAGVTDRLPPGSDVGHVHPEITGLDRSVAFHAEAVGMARFATEPTRGPPSSPRAIIATTSGSTSGTAEPHPRATDEGLRGSTSSSPNPISAEFGTASSTPASKYRSWSPRSHWSRRKRPSPRNTDPSRRRIRTGSGCAPPERRTTMERNAESSGIEKGVADR